MIINPIEDRFHNTDDFREQIAALFLGGINEEEQTITLLRSYQFTCLPGQASFDKDRPGANSLSSWEYIENLIDNQGAMGTFHTHPSGVDDFSGPDWSSMVGFAKATGNKYLWHGVQSITSPYAHFSCLHMINHRVFCYDCGQIASDPRSPVVTLPLPPKVDVSNGMYILAS